MGWLVLLLVVALSSVVLVTRNLLLRQLESDVRSVQVQEIEEFETFVSVGRNPRTGQPFADAAELLGLHLSRQRPNDDEILLGLASSAEFETLAQGRPDTAAAVSPELTAAIVDNPANQFNGMLDRLA